MPVTSPGPLKDAEYIGSWFSVELDNGITGYFTDVSGLAIDVGVVEVQASNEKGDTVSRKRPCLLSARCSAAPATLGIALGSFAESACINTDLAPARNALGSSPMAMTGSTPTMENTE